MPSYTQSLEHLVRYCARPAFALERLSVIGGGDDQPERILYALPRHKRSQWVGSGRNQKAPAPDAQGVVNVSPHEFLDRLADLVPPPRKRRHRYHGVFAPNHPLRPLVTALAIGNAGKSVGPGCTNGEKQRSGRRFHEVSHGSKAAQSVADLVRARSATL